MPILPRPLKPLASRYISTDSAREAGGLGLLELHPHEGRSHASGIATIRLRCNLGRPSCRKWLYLRKKRLKRTLARRGLKDAQITVVR